MNQKEKWTYSSRFTLFRHFFSLYFFCLTHPTGLRVYSLCGTCMHITTIDVESPGDLMCIPHKAWCQVYDPHTKELPENHSLGYFFLDSFAPHLDLNRSECLTKQWSYQCSSFSSFDLCEFGGARLMGRKFSNMGAVLQTAECFIV